MMEMASVEPRSAGLDAEAGSVHAFTPSSSVKRDGQTGVSKAPCPACGSSNYHSLLSAPTATGTRSLVSCTRCGLLRFLGTPAPSAPPRFLDLLLGHSSAWEPSKKVLQTLSNWVLAGPARFVLNQDWKKRQPKLVVQKITDTSLAKEARDGVGGVRSVFAAGDVTGITRAFYRHGFTSVAADSAEAPGDEGAADAVVRLRGFASENDPAGWLSCVTKKMRPDGRLYLQVYDCSSWAFLVCGSRWAGLEADSACYAYRAEDLEVLLDLCGLRIVRLSYYFPLLNAFVWAASLAPSLDGGDKKGETATPSTARSIAYLLLVCLLYPLALVESLCHTGSVVIVEAELKS